MKERLARLVQDRDADKESCQEQIDDLADKVDHIKESYVSLSHFDAVIEPIRRSMNTIERDVKELLGRVRG